MYVQYVMMIAFFIVIKNSEVERTTTTYFLHARLSSTIATLLTKASASPGADPTYRISSIIIIRACLVSTGDFLIFYYPPDQGQFAMLLVMMVESQRNVAALTGLVHQLRSDNITYYLIRTTTNKKET